MSDPRPPVPRPSRSAPVLAVVGAGPQLGYAIGARFAREGFRVAFISRTLTSTQQLADRLTVETSTDGRPSLTGPRAAGYAADVGDAPALVSALERATGELGDIEVLGFSPAVTAPDLLRHPLVPAEELDPDSALTAMQTFFFGGLTAIGHVLPQMIARRSGTLLATTGAGSGPLVIPEISNMTAAAAALRNWVLALNVSTRQHGVYAAHVALAAQIGQGRPGSRPDRIAEEYWQLHVRRDQAELFYDDMPPDWHFDLGTVRPSPGADPVRPT